MYSIISGVDTSAITVFGALMLLAINQKHQDLVVDELRSIFQTADCEIDQTHLAAMNYTERVLKETMRLFSPIPYVINWNHYTIKKLSLLIKLIFLVHLQVFRTTAHRKCSISEWNVAEGNHCSYKHYEYASKSRSWGNLIQIGFFQKTLQNDHHSATFHFRQAFVIALDRDIR